MSHAEKPIDSLNHGKNKLDEILTVGRSSGVRHGIGYGRESSEVKEGNSEIIFKKPDAQ